MIPSSLVEWECEKCGEPYRSPRREAVCPDCSRPPLRRGEELFRAGALRKDAFRRFAPPDPMPAAEYGTWRTWETCLLWGHTGTGKTMLALELLWQDIRDGRTAVFYHADDLMDLLMSRDATEREKSRPRRVSTLLLDELGSNSGEWAWNKLGGLIERRIGDGKKTIVTTNLSPNQIEVHRPRLASRLRADLVVRMTGADRRRERT